MEDVGLAYTATPSGDCRFQSKSESLKVRSLKVRSLRQELVRFLIAQRPCPDGLPKISLSARLNSSATSMTIVKTWWHLVVCRADWVTSCSTLQDQSVQTAPSQNLRTAIKSSLRKTPSH